MVGTVWVIRAIQTLGLAPPGKALKGMGRSLGLRAKSWLTRSRASIWARLLPCLLMAARPSLLLGEPPLRVSRNQTRHFTPTAGLTSICTLMSRRRPGRVHRIFHAMIISLPSWTELICVRFICLSTWILGSPIDVRHLMNRLATVEGFTVDRSTLVLGLRSRAERWELVAARIRSWITASVNSSRAKCPELLIGEISTLTTFMNKTSGILFLWLWAKTYKLLTQNLNIIL